MKIIGHFNALTIDCQILTDCQLSSCRSFLERCGLEFVLVGDQLSLRSKQKRELSMTISYNWLCDYLPVRIEPERLSQILTAVGLEVEGLERYEAVSGGLTGLGIGEVLECGPHPNPNTLKLTRVNTGGPELLSIVCGAANVAAGQKVVVALPGTTIYPVNGEPITLKTGK